VTAGKGCDKLADLSVQAGHQSRCIDKSLRKKEGKKKSQGSKEASKEDVYG
jgi:hypothetical protein